ncbi:MAG: hypothetical protein CME35_00920 [Gramella sp.]|nr:hypothetical protein [Christiangramia sp.]|tara:strand:+ start:578 stop:1465 length:888 start_codon:yes stop_codon:yes gene_type:complete
MARTTRPTSDSYDFQVVQEPLFNRGGKAAVVGKSPVMGNFRTDTGQCLGTSTEAYAIVQNGDLVEQVEDALGKSELGDFTSQKLVARDGARFYGVYDFPSMVKPVVLGDGAGMRLTLNNSFDRSTGVDFTLGLMRLICLNGQMTLVADTSVTKKHSHKLTLDFITDAIHSCTLKFEESIKDFGTLAEREITQEQGGLILDNLAIKKVLSESLRDSIQMVWDAPTHKEDEGRNLYNLYNATTQHLTHDVEGGRFEYARRVSHSVLKNLTKARDHAEHFGKLTQRVPKKDEVAITVS